MITTGFVVGFPLLLIGVGLLAGGIVGIASHWSTTARAAREIEAAADTAEALAVVRCRLAAVVTSVRAERLADRIAGSRPGQVSIVALRVASDIGALKMAGLVRH